MEKCRSDYRAGLLWMAEVSKELDPDVNKRLDKFRDVCFFIFLIFVFFYWVTWNQIVGKGKYLKILLLK